MIEKCPWFSIDLISVHLKYFDILCKIGIIWLTSYLPIMRKEYDVIRFCVTWFVPFSVFMDKKVSLKIYYFKAKYIILLNFIFFNFLEINWFYFCRYKIISKMQMIWKSWIVIVIYLLFSKSYQSKHFLNIKIDSWIVQTFIDYFFNYQNCKLIC